MDIKFVLEKLYNCRDSEHVADVIGDELVALRNKDVAICILRCMLLDSSKRASKEQLIEEFQNNCWIFKRFDSHR